MPAFISVVAFKKSRRDDMSVEEMVEVNKISELSSFGRGSTSFALSEQAMPAFISVVALKKSPRDDMSVEEMVEVNKIP
jgi:hypothetical protein